MAQSEDSQFDDGLRPDAGAAPLRQMAAGVGAALLVVAAGAGLASLNPGSSNSTALIAATASSSVATAATPSVTATPSTAPSVSAVAAAAATPSSHDMQSMSASASASASASGQGEGTAMSANPAQDGTALAASTLTDADRAAGLRSLKVQNSAGGTLVVVPGQVKAPGKGTVKRVRIEVEKGLDVDGAKFANTVMATLNDSRSWGKGGRMTFARVTGTADIRVVLASPNLSASMCRPLVTYGRLSCRSGSNAAVLTMYRWVNGTPDYGTHRVDYRRYLVNHEVGHVLGHSHQYCPGKGKLAPVMQQQTKGLMGCAMNPWPFP